MSSWLVVMLKIVGDARQLRFSFVALTFIWEKVRKVRKSYILFTKLYPKLYSIHLHLLNSLILTFKPPKPRPHTPDEYFS